MTCQANPRLEESRAVWARDGGFAEDLVPSFLACLRYSAAYILLASDVLTPS